MSRTKCTYGLLLSLVLAAGAWVSPWMQAARQRAALGECPFSRGRSGAIARLTAAQTPIAQSAPLAPAARSRSIWGLTFGVADERAVHDWAQQRGMSCHGTRKSARTLECTGASAGALASSWEAAKSLTVIFHFDGEHKVVAAHTLGSFAQAEAAMAALDVLARDVEHREGLGQRPAELSAAQALGPGLLSQVRKKLVYQNLQASFSATTFANHISVQEHIQAY